MDPTGLECCSVPSAHCLTLVPPYNWSPQEKAWFKSIYGDWVRSTYCTGNRRLSNGNFLAVFCRLWMNRKSISSQQNIRPKIKPAGIAGSPMRSTNGSVPSNISNPVDWQRNEIIYWAPCFWSVETLTVFMAKNLQNRNCSVCHSCPIKAADNYARRQKWTQTLDYRIDAF